MATLGLHCCTRAFSSCREWELFCVVVCGLRWLLWSAGSRAQAQELRLAGLAAPRHVLSSRARD